MVWGIVVARVGIFFKLYRAIVQAKNLGHVRQWAISNQFWHSGGHFGSFGNNVTALKGIIFYMVVGPYYGMASVRRPLFLLDTLSNLHFFMNQFHTWYMGV